MYRRDPGWGHGGAKQEGQSQQQADDHGKGSRDEAPRSNLLFRDGMNVGRPTAMVMVLLRVLPALLALTRTVFNPGVVQV
jgi:hypothetical protein